MSPALKLETVLVPDSQISLFFCTCLSVTFQHRQKQPDNFVRCAGANMHSPTACCCSPHGCRHSTHKLKENAGVSHSELRVTSKGRSINLTAQRAQVVKDPGDFPPAKRCGGVGLFNPGAQLVIASQKVILGCRPAFKMGAFSIYESIVFWRQNLG